MILVTGGAGFIGSNIVKGLNKRGISDILIVDNLKASHKFRNLSSLNFKDFINRETFLQTVIQNKVSNKIEAVFHLGGCSDTTEIDGEYLMTVNYTYSKHLFHFCANNKIPFYYASSAAVYGMGTTFNESRPYEKPINMYGFSKFQFDQYVRYQDKQDSPVVGLRYFNVYGPHEEHKKRMASVLFHFANQLNNGELIKLFGSSGGYAAGEQKRDFVFVEDVVAVNLWLLDNPSVSGIFNVGTGVAHSFNDVARTIISFYGRGDISYIPFPQDLEQSYQNYTKANLTLLRNAGYSTPFTSLQEGAFKYLKWRTLQQSPSLCTEQDM
jgi:ADP-L-glycero-D-manno-heptose 6-epimerase